MTYVGTSPNHIEKIYSGATRNGVETINNTRNEYLEDIITNFSHLLISPTAKLLTICGEIDLPILRANKRTKEFTELATPRAVFKAVLKKLLIIKAYHCDLPTLAIAK